MDPLMSERGFWEGPTPSCAGASLARWKLLMALWLCRSCACALRFARGSRRTPAPSPGRMPRAKQSRASRTWRSPPSGYRAR
eukprot:scaffold20366_cov66-Phaeocystis_antarctica.AAC.4